jgi:hypothetical protein
MIGRRSFAGLLLAGAVLAVGGCSSPQTHSYRFKMIVEVETPEGVLSGSSIYEIKAENRQAILPDEGVRAWSSRGEAIGVDLPGHRTLFALLKTGALHGDMASLSMATLDTAFNNDVVESAARLSNRHGTNAPVAVKPSDYPLLVTFKDMTDPTSVERVDPDDLSRSFGKGYWLKAITVQITDAPVTTGIQKRLAAMGMSPDNSLDKDFAPTTNPTLAQQLGYIDFVRN